jgi:Fuc2NAc and GlcNAc transferase
MGDSGSTFLGAIIAITLPIITDAIYTLSRRLLNHENIFEAHRKHLYQRLQQTGLGHSTVTSLYIILNLLIGLVIFTNNSMGAIISILITIGFVILGELYLSHQNRSIAGKI